MDGLLQESPVNPNRDPGAASGSKMIESTWRKQTSLEIGNIMKSTASTEPGHPLSSLPAEILLCIARQLRPAWQLSMTIVDRTIHHKISGAILPRYRLNHKLPLLSNAPSRSPSDLSDLDTEDSTTSQARTQFLQILYRYVPDHVYCPDCDILHTVEASSKREISSRKCYIMSSPCPSLLSTIQTAMRYYNQDLDYSNLLNQISVTQTRYHPSATHQTGLKAKIIGTRFILRTQHALLLPSGARSHHSRERFKSKYAPMIKDFLRDSCAMQGLMLRRYKGSLQLRDSRYPRILRQPYLAMASLRELRSVIDEVNPDTYMLESQTEYGSVSGRGYGVVITAWYDLGPCEYLLHHPLDWSYDVEEMFEAHEEATVMDSVNKYRTWEDDEALWKKKPRYQRENLSNEGKVQS